MNDVGQGFFAVYDGHAGISTAEYLVNNLHTVRITSFFFNISDLFFLKKNEQELKNQLQETDDPVTLFFFFPILYLMKFNMLCFNL